MSANSASKRTYPDVSPDGVDDIGPYILRKSIRDKNGNVIVKKDGRCFKIHLKNKQ